MGKKIFDTEGDTRQRYLIVKRVADIVGSVAAIVLLALPMLLIALTLKILYPQLPILFRQKRVGKNGELFTLIKFSSMKGSDVTKFGYFLRSTSMDELPQLFQVLSGRMSLIGPRPLIPQEKEIHIMRWESGVYQLRPGITGWAQVNGRRTLSDERKAAYDREYLEKMSFSMDWRIFRMTVKQLICQEGMNE